jgi:GNAT superfamily N-acetyltransferase
LSTPEYQFEPLGKHHDRAAFSCGDEALDHYLQRQARQDMAKNVAQVFVLVHRPTMQLAGFYTLSAFSVRATELPEDVARQLPRYPLIPATILGRLAIDQRYRGQGLGGVLLLNALRRARDASQLVASIAVVVDAKSDEARSFYEHYQFRRFISDEHRLFLPIGVIQSL